MGIKIFMLIFFIGLILFGYFITIKGVTFLFDVNETHYKCTLLAIYDKNSTQTDFDQCYKETREENLENLKFGLVALTIGLWVSVYGLAKSIFSN